MLGINDSKSGLASTSQSKIGEGSRVNQGMIMLANKNAMRILKRVINIKTLLILKRFAKYYKRLANICNPDNSSYTLLLPKKKNIWKLPVIVSAFWYVVDPFCAGPT